MLHTRASICCRKVPSAGGEKWVEQFANEHPPEIVAEAQAKENNVVGSEGADFPGWGESEEILKERPKKESKKKKNKRVVEEESTSEIKTDDITAADGALVVHGAGDAAAAAVTTMFGDLLAIDDGPRNHVAIPKSAPRPPTELSNAQALRPLSGWLENLSVVSMQHYPLLEITVTTKRIMVHTKNTLRVNIKCRVC